MGLDRGERRLGVEARQQHEVVAVHQPFGRPDRWTVVVQRARHHHALVGSHVQHRRHVGVADRRITRHDQLRPAGAPARRRRLPSRRHQLEIVDVGQVDVEADVGRPVTDRQARATGERVGLDAEHDPRIRQLDDRLQLAMWEPGRHRLRHRADPPDGVLGDEPVDRVGERDRHHVAMLHTSDRKVAGEQLGRVAQPGAGDALLAARDGRPDRARPRRTWRADGCR